MAVGVAVERFPSDGGQGLAVSGSHARHVFQLAGVGHVVAGLVLRQDLHQWAELQPPLVLGDPVTEQHKWRGGGRRRVRSRDRRYRFWQIKRQILLAFPEL